MNCMINAVCMINEEEGEEVAALASTRVPGGGAGVTSTDGMTPDVSRAYGSGTPPPRMIVDAARRRTLAV